MTTVKMNTSSKRFAMLAQMGEQVFHIDDLANLWKITNENTLYITLRRYVKQGALNRIYRGLYSLQPLNKLNPYLLGLKAMREYSYISTETVLVNHGIIQQSFDRITIVSSKSKKFYIGDYKYKSRQLAPKFLFQDIGINEKNGIKMASLERAIADLLYFNPRAYFDAHDKINWKAVEDIQKKIGYIK
jgi:predicted transcriptional regulator of viral defense system